MTKMDDFDYIKNKFDQDGIETPESLSAESMLEKIRTESTRKPAAKNDSLHINWKRTLALAASLILAIGAVHGARLALRGQSGGATGTKTAKTISDDSFELETFDSEKDVRKYVAKLNKETFQLFGSSKSEEIAMDDVETPAAAEDEQSDAMPNAAADGQESGSHSETYNQVDGVDEADIIKTDGKYIFHVSGYEEIEIYRADDGEVDHRATVSLFDEDGSVSEIYLSGETLVAVGSQYHEKEQEERAVVITYDISDPEHPEKIGEFEQAGDIVSTRLADGIIYLVTEQYADNDRYMPCVTADGVYGEMDVNDIAAFPKAQESNYVIVSSVDVASGLELESRSKAVLGASEYIYCSTGSLYIASTDYTADSGATKLIKTDLKGGELRFSATGKVRGRIIGQFAMDEQDGYFRIATTALKGDSDVNNLFVLDDKLDVVGSVKGFARNESIKAIRFIGERAYVITYEQIDPLFVIDVSNPEEPKIDGEVEISGFSTLLAPVEGDKLVGIGYATEDNGYGGQMQAGLKIALFDVSDPSNPAVIDEKEFTGINSQAQYNHHALLQNSEKDYLAIPYEFELYPHDVIIEDAIVEDAEEPSGTDEQTGEPSQPEEETGERVDDKIRQGGGVLIFTADDEIDIVEDHVIEGDSGIVRCVYIDDYIYALNGGDEIVGFEMK